jgi:hypothetical protein
VVSLWETATGTLIAKLTGHKAAIAAFAFVPDGNLLATGSWDGTVRLWEVATGRAIAKLSGHRGGVTALAFSADGKRLAAGGSDGTILVWQLQKLPTDWGVPAVKLPAAGLDKLWDQLSVDDGAVAYKNLWLLVGAPNQTVPFLKQSVEKLLPTQARLKTLLSELDATKFQVREKAMRDLTELGPEIIPQLRKTIDDGCSLEVRLRLDKVLARLGEQESSLPSRELRAVRIVWALEYIGTPQAKELLASLAAEHTPFRLGHEAKAALQRLTAR